MEAILPLDRMNTEEKLRAMETLWADLSRDETAVESPAWHGEILREREAGEQRYLDWETAKEEIRQRLG